MHVAYLGEVGGDANAARGEQLQGDAAGGADGCREPTREVPASRHILVSVPLGMGREVRMARPGRVEDVVVVARAGVGVLDDDGERGPAGLTALVEAGKDVWLVGLLAGRRPICLARGASRHEGTQLVEIGGKARGQPLDHAADGCGMGLSEDRHAQGGTEGRCHCYASSSRAMPPSARKSSKKLGYDLLTQSAPRMVVGPVA